ncbi:acyltransferase family protein [Rhodopirellula baltica]|uniref:Lipopolysaccharide modification acyltransferase n=1 Tax=Rhodopirellula baltica WH47 TaxID=991778 RepID=F2ALR2_RHOBT|nr:acyltransferase family protein [Rhodopirellula baltica]EGF29408.1 lipopolysaccharide modification acyltransferase [Rhodopirellula baltica WH47]
MVTPPPTSTPTISYRPEIDGLRGIAVIPVILFHLDAALLPGGWVGVDVFFVISGFLITSILLRDLSAGEFSFRQFWMRRCLRILPSLLAVAGISLLISWSLVFAPDQIAISRQAIAALTSVSNIYLWRSTGDYWSVSAEQSPFLHTWSLSIEEQFYLFLPVAIWLTASSNPGKRLQLAGSVLLVSLALFVWGSSAHPSATFYLLPARGWELLAGCVLSIAATRVSLNSISGRIPFTSTTLSMAGLILVLISYICLDRLGLGLIAPVAGTLLILCFSGNGICTRILTQGWLKHIGKLSYSLYLWHWPAIVFATYFGLWNQNLHEAVPLLFCIYFLSLANYKYIECPIRYRRGAFPWIVCLGIVLVGLASLMSLQSARYDSSDFATPVYYGQFYDMQPGSPSAAFKEKYFDWRVPVKEAESEAFLHGGIIIEGNTPEPQIVVLGDSIGTMWSNVIREAAEQRGITISLLSAGSVSPLLRTPPRTRDVSSGRFSGNDLHRFDKAVLRVIESWKPKLVMIGAAWSRRQEAEAEDLLCFLQKHAVQVQLIEQPPILRELDRRNCLQFLVYQGVKPERGIQYYFPSGSWDGDDELHGSRIIRSLSKRFENCEILPVNDIYEKEGKTLVLDGDEVVYLDFLHLSEFGAQMAASRIGAYIDDAFDLPSN